jgi:hypothetical protein
MQSLTTRAGIASLVMAVVMLVAMLPGLAHVSIEGPIVPAPLPAPSPTIVDASAD